MFNIKIERAIGGIAAGAGAAGAAIGQAFSVFIDF